MNKPAAVFIRAAISGYMGEPVTLYGLYAPDRDILMISRLTAFEPSRKNDSYTLITNKKGHAHDYFFSDQLIMNGVEAFYDRQNSKTQKGGVALKIDPVVATANPISVIERDSLDANGWKYRLSDLTNSHVAVLATCLYVSNVADISQTLDMADDLSNLMAGHVVTI